MSGPKVVRIVTREEILMLCQGHLARLDAAVEEWARIGHRNGTIGEEELRSVKNRADRIHALLKQDLFMDLQKEVPQAIQFLSDDQEDRLARAAAEAATARSTQRRIAATARGTLARLQQKGVSVPPDLRRELEEVAAERSDDSASIGRALRLLATDDAPGLSDRQRRLAAALREDEGLETVNDWIAAQPVNEQDDRIARLDRRISEIVGRLGEKEETALRERLRMVSAADGARQHLLLDSLSGDLARMFAAAKDRSARQVRLRGLAAELSQVQSQRAATIAEGILANMDAADGVLGTLEQDAEAARDEFNAIAAAHARRQAVLTALAALGYAVSEDLETAWVQDGRVVLKKPSQPGYGVEIGGGPDAQRLQMRTVAFRPEGTHADTARDVDAETLWCSDFAKLNAEIGQGGGTIHIEAATPVGTVPVKAVAEEAARPVETYNRDRPAERRRGLT